MPSCYVQHLDFHIQTRVSATVVVFPCARQAMAESDTADLPWAAALDDELCSLQKLSQEISDAEICRTPSTDGEGEGDSGRATVYNAPPKSIVVPSQSDVQAPPPSTTWWAVVLRQAAKKVCPASCFEHLPSLNLQTVSGCTGCCAEGFALKAWPDKGGTVATHESKYLFSQIHSHLAYSSSLDKYLGLGPARPA